MYNIQNLMEKALSEGKPTSASFKATLIPTKHKIHDTTARLLPLPTKALNMNTPSSTRCSRSQNIFQDFFSASSERVLFKDIAQLQKVWCGTKRNKAKKIAKNLKLHDNVTISSDVLQFIGHDTCAITQNDIAFSIAIFAGYVEMISFIQAKQKSNDNLQKLLLFQDGILRVDYRFSNDTIQWTLQYKEEENFGFIKLVQSIFNCSWLDALETLSCMVGISFEYMFSVYNVEHDRERNNDSQIHNENINYFHLEFDGLKNYAAQKNTILITGYNGQPIGGIAIYESGDKVFTLPVTAVQGKLSIGENKATAIFFNQAKLDATPNTTIILCQNILLAFALNNMFEHRNDVLVVGHYGHDLSVLPWNFFWKKRVLLICSPDIYLYSQVSEYYTSLQKAKVRQVSIFPFPLQLKTSNKTLDFTNLNLLEAELVKKTYNIAEEGSIQALLQHINNKSLSYEEFVHWGESLDLFVKQKKSSVSNSNIVPAFTCEPHTTSNPVKFDEISLEHILPTKGVSLIYGKKNVGKSNVVLGFIKALTQHQDFGGIRKVPSPHPVILFDTETMAESFNARLRQFGLTENLNDNLHCLVKLSCPPDSEWAQFDLSNPDHRQMLQEYGYFVNAKHIFFDNITSGVKAGGTYTQKIFGDIFSWTPKLHEKNMGFIIVHHAHDDGQKSSIYAEVRGSNELIIRSHTIMILIGCDEIAKNITPSPDHVRAAAKKLGATVGIYFKTCKLANILEGTILWGHLPQNASDWQWLAHTNLEGKELENSLLSSPATASNDLTVSNAPPTVVAVSDVNVETQYNDASSLSIDEKKVLKRLETQEYIKTKDVMEAIDCERSKALSILNNLIKKGRIQTEGQGKSIKYVLAQ